MSEIIRFEDYGYGYPESEDFVLRKINFSIRAGECHCLGGPTGSGKTSLALAAKGLLPGGDETGGIERPATSRVTGSGIGLVLQNPETQLLTRSVGAETAFGLENLCVAPGAMLARVKEALRQVGLEKALDSETAKLSMGEKYRLIMAGQLAMAPRLLILDEPAAQLDPDGLGKLLDIVQRLKKAGVGMLLCENNPGPLKEAVDDFWHLDGKGHLLPGPYRNAETNLAGSFPCARPADSEPAVEAVRVTELTVSGTDGAPLWSDVSFTLPQGWRAVLYGRNGSGKTTLLRCLTGFQQPAFGRVWVLGRRPEAANLRGRVGCLFQNPQKQLFETNVFDEVAFPLKRLRKNHTAATSNVAEALALCRIENLARLSPHKLSYGQKHLVALASVVASAPSLLLLDDPFAGLDPSRSEQILSVLTHLNENQGTTILLTSHNPDVLRSWADLSLHIAGGKLERL
jgi:energy-coupling factor transporter ATP-binding protein EcfA2